MQTWSTVFISVCVQATPFLVLGVLVSGAIAAFVPARVFAGLLPRNPVLAVPVAGVCGIALPGCECGSVPIANRLMERGVRPSAALAFLLSAPAINPIVLVATAVAFQSDGRMVWARLIAGLLTSVIVGLVWERIGRPEWMRPRARTSDAALRPARGSSSTTVGGDFAQVAGFLVVGAAAAATFNVLVPVAWMEHVGSSLLLSVLLMAVLAFVLALCSESDAFVAAAFTTIPLVGKLVFLTVGPAVDVKLVALQAGTFGRRFAVRFAPLTFVVAAAHRSRRRAALLRCGAVTSDERGDARHRDRHARRAAVVDHAVRYGSRPTSGPGFKPMLLIAGVLLLALAVVSLVMAIRDDVRKPAEVSGHDDDGHDPRPLARHPGAVADDAAGARAAFRGAARPGCGRGRPRRHLRHYGPGRDDLPDPPARSAEPLPAGNPVPLSCPSSCRVRCTTRTTRPRTPTSRSTAFITRSPCDGSGYSLVRLKISCCAADAIALRTHIDAPPQLPANTWVEATIRAVRNTGDQANNYVPTATVISMRTIPQPANPYET